MKKSVIILNISVLVIFSFLLVWQHFTKERIAYVELNEVFDKYEGMKVAKKEFENKSRIWQANIDTLYLEFENELKKYEKTRSSMSKKEQELNEELLRNKQGQIQNYQQAMQKKASEEDQKITQTIVNEINDYVKEYGAEYNLSIIFGANGSGNVMYGKERINITKDIIERLNKEY